MSSVLSIASTPSGTSGENVMSCPPPRPVNSRVGRNVVMIFFNDLSCTGLVTFRFPRSMLRVCCLVLCISAVWHFRCERAVPTPRSSDVLQQREYGVLFVRLRPELHRFSYLSLTPSDTTCLVS